MIDFPVQKTKLYDRVKSQLNERQEKALARIFREGVEGFKGGLSAENYISITGAARATAMRDVQDLVDNGVVIRTRYTAQTIESPGRGNVHLCVKARLRLT